MCLRVKSELVTKHEWCLETKKSKLFMSHDLIPLPCALLREFELNHWIDLAFFSGCIVPFFHIYPMFM